jgi:radical SAM protein with 4Fe4S-binding SPASM domain
LKKEVKMFYCQKFDTFIRIYDDVGYITNKSDFSDRVVSKSGAVFLSVLSREPQQIDDIARKIIEKFVGVDIETIKNDAKCFYEMLETDGFIVSGKTPKECNQKDTRFSYKALEPKTIKNDFSPKIMRANKSTQEFLEEHFKDKPHLMSLQIEVTSKCNERCVHCYIPYENRTTDIDPELLYDVLDQCKTMGVLDLTLSGGEPMLHKNFSEFLRKCKEYDFSVNILSNLTLLNDEIIAEMKANRLSSVQVSLYSMNPEIHDGITQLKGSFEKTKANILKLIENDIPLQISCPTMKKNKNCFVDVIRWAQEQKVRATTDVIMMARYDGTTENLANRLSLDEVEKIFNDIIENDIKYQDAMKIADYDKADKRDISNDIVCGVCVTSIGMVANGNIYPCPGWQSYVLGNVKETPLKEIWENSERVKYLRSLRKKDFLKCLKCPDRSFCAMCMVRNANEHPSRDPLAINEHFCKVAKVNREIVLKRKEKIEKYLK